MASPNVMAQCDLRVLLLVVGMFLAIGARPAGAELGLESSAIVIDKSTKSGTAVVYVGNDSSSAVRRRLRVHGFTTEAGVALLEARASVGEVDPKSTSAKRTDSYEVSVPAKGTVAVKVEVTNFTEAGSATAPLFADAESIGAITAVRHDVPFAVKLAGAPSERPEVTLRSVPEWPWTSVWRCVKAAVCPTCDAKGGPTGAPAGRLTVRNDDPLTYDVDWELIVNDVSVPGRATLMKSGPTDIVVQASSGWFRGPTSHLRDDLQDGTLVLRFRPAGIPAAHALVSKEFPLRARLRSGSPLYQTVTGTTVVAILVFLGGLSSLLLRFWIPNRMAGIDLHEHLTTITDRTRALSTSIDSSVRVLVRVQRHRLAELATSRIPFSPDWSATLEECKRRIVALGRQLDILEAVDRLGKAVEARRTQPGVPAAPTLLDGVQARLTLATDRLRTTEPKAEDVQGAQAALSEADTLLQTIDRENPEFEKILVGRFRDIYGWYQIAKAGTAIKQADGLRLAASLSDGVPAAIPPASYGASDLTSLRLVLLRDYLTLYGKSTPQVQQSLCKPDGPQARFFASIDVDGWEWLRDARFMYLQMDQGVYVDTVCAKIAAKEIDIVASPPSAGPYEPIRFRAWFRSELVGRCVAREDVVCHWTFFQGKISWQEEGWEVWHYFPEDGTYRVTATFTQKTTGQPIPSGSGVVLGLEYTIGTQRTNLMGTRTRLELVRFGIVFGATLLGLLAGGREQLLKLDLVGGVIAVFLLGFSADTIKNLITGK